MEPGWWQKKSLEVLELPKTSEGDLIPYTFGFERCSRKKGRITYRKNCYTFHFVLEGHGSFQTDHSFELGEGNAFLLLPGETFSYGPSPRDPWVYLWVEFGGDKAKEILSSFGFSKESLVLRDVPTEEILALFDLIFFDKTRFGGGDALRYALTGRLYWMFGLLADGKKSPLHPSFRASARAAYEAQEYIRNHSSDSSFTILEAAAHFGYHPAYFSRLLKKEVGMSPSEILARTRLEKSAVLLCHDTLTISQIASACGFGNPYYFSREFKRFYGVPPSSYRKEKQKS
ncbi:MAG: AraC family transcriptional regulator [Candidatus Enteromonas sp.]|nr:AraC family transcriptional regulator [Candidatus Enteromonas sp.]